MKPTYVYLDIETIPEQRPGALEEFKALVKAPAQYKKLDSIVSWLAENRDAEGEEAWLKTSFDGGRGQLCVLGWAIGDDGINTYSVGNSEAEALRCFFDSIRELGACIFVGHYVASFDIRFIWQRAVVLGVKPPPNFPRDPKPWDERAVFDTMHQWAGAKGSISLDALCKILGIAGKGGMDGSQVWPLVRDGQIEKVARYCEGDVDRVRKIHKRLTFA